MDQIENEAPRTYNVKSQYRSGLRARMREYAAGRAKPLTGLTTVSDADPAAQAFADGYADAADDSDEPRPDDPAALQAMARAVFAEIERIGADVSAWPDYERGQLCLDDGLTSERHDPETLLATLRGLPAGAGAVAMWEATAAIAVHCLTWNACVVVTDQSAGPAYSL